MDKNEALNILVRSVQVAQQRGAYKLDEAATIHNAIQVFNEKKVSSVEKEVSNPVDFRKLMMKVKDVNDFVLEKLDKNKELNEAFGEKVIKSYIKLKNNEIDNFNSKENFSKNKPITEWEKLNTLDC